MQSPIILKAVKQAIREPYAWPGGYPVYAICSDGELLCTECARENYRQIASGQWAMAGLTVNWESENETCAHCGKILECAYPSD